MFFFIVLFLFMVLWGLKVFFVRQCGLCFAIWYWTFLLFTLNFMSRTLKWIMCCIVSCSSWVLWCVLNTLVFALKYVRFTFVLPFKLKPPMIGMVRLKLISITYHFSFFSFIFFPISISWAIYFWFILISPRQLIQIFVSFDTWSFFLVQTRQDRR